MKTITSKTTIKIVNGFKYSSFILLLLLLIIGACTETETTIESENENQDFLIKGSVSIKSNKDFDRLTKYFSGSGTRESPYTLQDKRILFLNNFGIRVENTTKYFRIKGVQINLNNRSVSAGNNDNLKGIFLNNVTNCVIEDATIKGFQGEGIHIINSNNVTIKHSKIHNVRRGVLIECGTGIHVYENEIAFVEKRGVYAKCGREFANISIFDNHIHHNSTPDSGGEGIVVRGRKASNVKVNGNIVHDIQDDGIEFIRVEKSEIIGNSVYNNLGQGIELFSESNGNIVSSNFVYDNQTSGIVLTRSSGNRIFNNIVYKNHPAGIAIAPAKKDDRGYSRNNTIYGMSPRYNTVKDFSGMIEENTIIYAGVNNLNKINVLPITSKNQIFHSAENNILRVNLHFGSRKVVAKVKLKNGDLLWTSKPIPEQIIMDLEPEIGIVDYTIRAVHPAVDMNLEMGGVNRSILIRQKPLMLFGKAPDFQKKYGVYLNGKLIRTYFVHKIEFKVRLSPGQNRIRIKPIDAE